MEPPSELKQLQLTSKASALVEKHRAADCEASLLSPALQMKPGLTVEVEDAHEPRTVWLAKIRRNVGGRLLVQYNLPTGMSGDEVSESCQEWIFCLSPRLHWRGWANQSQWSFKPPTRLRSLYGDQWEAMAEQYRTLDGSTTKPWQFNLGTSTHNYKVGDVISAVNKRNPLSLVKTAVVEVIDEQRYAIRLPVTDDDRKEMNEGEGDELHCCFPARRDEPECDFEANMALEVVNPFRPAEICIGVITAIEENGSFLRIQPELDGASEFYVSTDSQDIFPVGWCDSQNYPLTPPLFQAVVSDPPTQPETEGKFNIFIFQDCHR